MKTNELRLGNWVEFEDGGFPMQVVAIYDDSICLDFEGNNGDVWEEDGKDIAGIQLTDEILLGCSDIIKKIGYFVFGVLNKNMELQPIRGGGYNLFFAGRYIHPIRFVHELQNIYFALTGEELMIKLG